MTSRALPVVIQGASRGLGLEIARQLVARGRRVFATCRRPDAAAALRELERHADGALEVVPLDVKDEASITGAAARVEDAAPRLGLLMNVAGVLHSPSHRPERKVDEVDPAWLAEVFRINAFGPLLVAKHFGRLLQHDARAVLANVSARVGSIGDNRLGGWYAYRGSKAAQNMFTKGLSIELVRRSPQLVVVALHPGTVATDLSAPFVRRAAADRAFSVERGARQLLDVVEGLTPDDNGRFFAWDGQPIEW